MGNKRNLVLFPENVLIDVVSVKPNMIRTKYTFDRNDRWEFMYNKICYTHISTEI